MKKIALISMPFGAVDRPAFGISLLKASLHEKGFDCDIHYLYKSFVNAIGIEEYQWLTDGVPYTSFVGDWIFTRALYGQQFPESQNNYVDSILRNTWQFKNEDVTRVLIARQRTEAYITQCVNEVDWSQYSIVGFTSTFTQNIASLALARRIKERFNDITIVFGGANWESQMGFTLHSKFPFVDYVCSGEADISFPKLVQLINDEQPITKAVKGVVFKNANGLSEYSSPAAPVLDMNRLPTPDYSDYFAVIQNDPQFEKVNPSLIMETSRGCWWGAKHHCTFCGLNGNGMTFRVKDSDRALRELKELVTKWPVQLVSMADNIIDMTYFESFVKELARNKLDVQLFYETKSNLKRDHVKVLAEAKVWNIQPGIESLSDHVLNLMRKGTSALRNIQLLKWCKEYKISVDWNILYGFPGETAKDYLNSFRLLTLIPHLQPPSGTGPIRLDRFSPYFQTPDKFGLHHVSALKVFEYLYPFDRKTLDNIACYFDFEYIEPPSCSNEVSQVLKLIDQLNSRPHRGELRVVDTGKELRISDSRVGYPGAVYRLSYYDRALYLLIDEVVSVKTIARELKNLFRHERFELGDIEGRLNEWTKLGLAAKDADRYLALAVHDYFPEDWKKTISDFIDLHQKKSNHHEVNV